MGVYATLHACLFLWSAMCKLQKCLVFAKDAHAIKSIFCFLFPDEKHPTFTSSSNKMFVVRKYFISSYGKYMPIQKIGGNLVHREIANLRSRLELKRCNIYVTLRYIPKKETQEIPLVFHTKIRPYLWN